MAYLFNTNLHTINPYTQPTIEERIQRTTVQTLGIPVENLLTATKKEKALLIQKTLTNAPTVIALNGWSFPLQSKDNVVSVICENIYLGRGFFLTCITRETIALIQAYSQHYFIRINDSTTVKVNEIYPCPQSLENANLIIAVLKTNDYLDNSLPIANLIETSLILSHEIINGPCNYFSEYSNYETGSINYIEQNTIFVNTDKDIKNGSPLIVEGVIIGINYQLKNSIATFYRISSILYWLAHFYTPPTGSKGLRNSAVNKTPLTEEQLYSIIYDLNARVKTLEGMVSTLQQQ